MIFPVYLVIQGVLWWISGGKWTWLLKNTEIFMILSTADSYFASDIIGVFNRFLGDLALGIFYPKREALIKRRLVELQDKIIRTAALAVISLLIDQFFV
jgi:hypothetical protein